MKIKATKGERIFDIFNFLIMTAAVIVCLYPLWYVLVASFSDGNLVSQGKVTFWVEGFNIDAYKKALETPYIGSAYANTLFYSVVGVILSMIFTALGAYPLSKKRLHGRKIITLFITFTMWFNAGLMPSFITYRAYGLLDTRMGVLMSGLVSTFYVFIMRNSFEGVPDALEESMKLDGASDFKVFWHIYLPLCVPTLMTLTLYYFVQRWNTYFWPMIILQDETLVPLQVILKKLVVDMSGLYENMNDMDVTSITKENMVYATMMLAVVPMLVLYPFIQKFFVKGITVGAVKG